MRHYTMPLLLSIFFTLITTAQTKESEVPGNVEAKATAKESKRKIRVFFGTASYYADKFNGRETANGEIYDHSKPTAACNILPLGTWIRVTNMKNERTIVVKINDRLHPKMKRLVDLSLSSAQKLGYSKMGLTQVKVEVLGEVKL